MQFDFESKWHFNCLQELEILIGCCLNLYTYASHNIMTNIRSFADNDLLCSTLDGIPDENAIRLDYWDE